MKDHLNTPIWKSKTFWLSVGPVSAFGVEIVNQVLPIVPERYTGKMVALGGVLAALGNLAARSGGVKAARQAAGQE